ncbi:MAG TPA: hypothetical protein VGG20_00285 [Thermoanaerobaculia bacterium]
MLKLRLTLLAAVCMSLASVFPASAAPLPSPFSQGEDPLKQVFLASSRIAKPLPIKCGTCDMATGGTTPTATAIGTSCTMATSNLTAQLVAYATSVCGPRHCSFVITVTIGCHPDSGGYSITGYATFHCYSAC